MNTTYIPETPLGDSAECPLQLSSIRFMGYVSLVGGLGLLLVFEFLRSREERMCRCLYRQRHSVRFRKKNPRLRKICVVPYPCGFLAWVHPAWHISDADFLDQVGLDGYCVIRFIRMCRRLCLCATLGGCLVLLPLYASGDTWSSGDGNFCFLTMANIQMGQGVWVTAFFAWIFTLYLIYQLRMEHVFFTEIRNSWLAEGDPGIERQAAYTIMVERIPKAFRSPAMLSSFFGTIFPGQVHSSTIALNLNELASLMAKRDNAVQRLEFAANVKNATGVERMVRAGGQKMCCAWVEDGEGPGDGSLVCCGKGGPLVGEIEYYGHLVSSLNDMLRPLQASKLAAANAVDKLKEEELKDLGLVLENMAIYFEEQLQAGESDRRKRSATRSSVSSISFAIDDSSDDDSFLGGIARSDRGNGRRSSVMNRFRSAARKVVSTALQNGDGTHTPGPGSPETVEDSIAREAKRGSAPPAPGTRHAILHRRETGPSESSHGVSEEPKMNSESATNTNTASTPPLLGRRNSAANNSGIASGNTGRRKSKSGIASPTDVINDHTEANKSTSTSPHKHAISMLQNAARRAVQQERENKTLVNTTGNSQSGNVKNQRKLQAMVDAAAVIDELGSQYLREERKNRAELGQNFAFKNWHEQTQRRSTGGSEHRETDNLLDENQPISRANKGRSFSPPNKAVADLARSASWKSPLSPRSPRSRRTYTQTSIDKADSPLDGGTIVSSKSHGHVPLPPPKHPRIVASLGISPPRVDADTQQSIHAQRGRQKGPPAQIPLPHLPPSTQHDASPPTDTSRLKLRRSTLHDLTHDSDREGQGNSPDSITSISNVNTGVTNTSVHRHALSAPPESSHIGDDMFRLPSKTQIRVQDPPNIQLTSKASAESNIVPRNSIHDSTHGKHASTSSNGITSKNLMDFNNAAAKYAENDQNVTQTDRRSASHSPRHRRSLSGEFWRTGAAPGATINRRRRQSHEPSGLNSTSESPRARNAAEEVKRQAAETLRNFQGAGKKVAEAIKILTVGSMSNTGFVTFKTLSAREMAVQSLIANQRGVFECRAAVSPREIVWPNVTRHARQIMCWRTFVSTCVGLGLVFWASIVSGIQALTSEETLAKISPKLHDAVIGNEFLAKVITIYLPVLLLILLLNNLYFILKAIARRLEGYKTEFEIERAVMLRYFYFQLANVFITVTAGSLFIVLKQVANNPTQLASILGGSLPGVAMFFLNLIIIKAVSGLMLELCFGGRPLKFWRILAIEIFTNPLLRTKEDRTRGVFERSEPWFGRFTSDFLLVLLITFVYQIIAPFMSLFSLAYFLLAEVIYKYQLLHCFWPLFESGGQFFYVLYRQVVIGAAAGLFTLIGYMSIRQAVAEIPFLVPLPFLVLTLGFRWAAEGEKWSSRLSLDRASLLDTEGMLAEKRHEPPPWLDFDPNVYLQPVLKTAVDDESIHRGGEEENSDVDCDGWLDDFGHPSPARTDSHTLEDNLENGFVKIEQDERGPLVRVQSALIGGPANRHSTYSVTSPSHKSTVSNGGSARRLALEIENGSEMSSRNSPATSPSGVYMYDNREATTFLRRLRSTSPTRQVLLKAGKK